MADPVTIAQVDWRLRRKSSRDTAGQPPPGMFWFEVIAKCPECSSELPLQHEIAADGTITPSLDCPACPFHQAGVRLEGWPYA